MTDRRRANGPPGGTTAPVFIPTTDEALQPLIRKRKANELRKIYLKTGLVPSATGSAYLELESSSKSRNHIFPPRSSTIKLSCTVHGPKPLPRTASFSPNLQLSSHVKIAPFATSVRRGYIRDAGERDLSIHLETALKAVVLADRYPKSAIDVTVTVLEAEEDGLLQYGESKIMGVGAMNLLSGCITVASAALADARVDCLDLMAGGVAIITSADKEIILDPSPNEHGDIISACVLGYLPNRDEITELWMKGDALAITKDGQRGLDTIIDAAVGCAKGAQIVLQDVVRESTVRHLQEAKALVQGSTALSNVLNDIEMKS